MPGELERILNALYQTKVGRASNVRVQFGTDVITLGQLSMDIESGTWSAVDMDDTLMRGLATFGGDVTWLYLSATDHPTLSPVTMTSETGTINPDADELMRGLTY